MEELKYFLNGLEKKYITRNEPDFIQYSLPFTDSDNLDLMSLKGKADIDTRTTKDRSIFYYIMRFENMFGYKRIFIQITVPIYKKDRALRGTIVNLFK